MVSTALRRRGPLGDRGRLSYGKVCIFFFLGSLLLSLLRQIVVDVFRALVPKPGASYGAERMNPSRRVDHADP
jgi:hypothetical protein